jgi:hypothetical protein
LWSPYREVRRINDEIIDELAMLAFEVRDHPDRPGRSRANLEQLDYYGLPRRPDWGYDDAEDDRAPKDGGLRRSPRGHVQKDANGLYLLNKSTAGDWTARQQSGAAVEYAAIAIADGTATVEDVMAWLGETRWRAPERVARGQVIRPDQSRRDRVMRLDQFAGYARLEHPPKRHIPDHRGGGDGGLLAAWEVAGLDEPLMQARFLTELGFTHREAGEILRIARQTVTKRLRGAR